MTWFSFELFLLLLFTVIAGFFAGTEVAYTGLNLSHIKRTHKLRPGFFNIWEKHPELVLTTLLLSNNAVGTAVGVLAAHMGQESSQIWPLRESVANLLCSVFAGTVLLLFGEILPKVYAKQFTMAWALAVTPFMNIWTRILFPVSTACVKIINQILRLQKKQPSVVSIESELKSILEHSTIPVSSKRILDSVLGFSRAQVRDCMTPRPQIMALSIKEPMHKIIQSVIQSGYSRIPVYSGSFDNMVGVLYSKDLLVSWRSHTLFLLEDLLRPLYAVEEGQPISDIIRTFKTGRYHLAVVKDNLLKGRVTGLVTLQDALEALVGPIEEEV